MCASLWPRFLASFLTILAFFTCLNQYQNQKSNFSKPWFFVRTATQLDFCVTTTQFLFPWNHDQLEPRKTRCCNYLSTSLPVDYQLHQWQHDIPVGKCGFHNEADGHKVEHMKMALQKNKQESWSGREKLTQVNLLEKKLIQILLRSLIQVKGNKLDRDN